MKEDLIERDVDLAWELFEAQPTHPEIPRLVHRVLAAEERRSGMRILLAMHHRACGEADVARTVLLDIIGRRDQQFINAARELRDLEHAESNYEGSLHWAQAVMREDQEDWLDLMELGVATSLAEEFEAGWKLIDDAVLQCAETDVDNLPGAFAKRAISLLETMAPPERFIPAAEEAMHADPSSEFIGVPLSWAYVHQGRFGDAEELCLRMLRLDPTAELPEVVLTMIRTIKKIVDDAGLPIEQVHEVGLLRQIWDGYRDEHLGIDLAPALAALDQVLPDDLRAALHPPAADEVAQDSPGIPEIAAWHDGQVPGTGDAWGVAGGFRLMTADEIRAMDEDIEAHPESYPDWKEESLADEYHQVMTDDAGGYVIEKAGGHLAVRRAGAEDEPFADSLKDWVWDRVAAFGGRDPRPVRRRDGDRRGDT